MVLSRTADSKRKPDFLLLLVSDPFVQETEKCGPSVAPGNAFCSISMCSEHSMACAVTVTLNPQSAPAQLEVGTPSWFGHMQQPVYAAHILIIESLEVDTTWSPIYTVTNEDTSWTWLCMVLMLSKLWNIHRLMVPSTLQEAEYRPLWLEAVQILESTDCMLLRSSFKISSHLRFWAPTKAETVTDYGVKMAQVSRILYHSICTVLVGEIPFNLDIFFLCIPLSLILIL